MAVFLFIEVLIFAFENQDFLLPLSLFHHYCNGVIT